MSLLQNGKLQKRTLTYSNNISKSCCLIVFTKHCNVDIVNK